MKSNENQTMRTAQSSENPICTNGTAAQKRDLAKYSYWLRSAIQWREFARLDTTLEARRQCRRKMRIDARLMALYANRLFNR